MDTWMIEVYMRKEPARENRLIEEAKKLGGVLDYREDEGDRVILTLEFTDWNVALSAMEALAIVGEGKVHIEGPSAYG
jgi:hypothetical protein